MEGLSAGGRAGGGGAGRNAAESARWCVRGAVRLSLLVQHTTVQVIDHDCLNVAQSAAYAAIFALFPALIVVAAVVTLLPYAAPLRLEVAHFFARVLPGDVTPLLETYFAAHPKTPQTTHGIVVAALVSFSGASSVIATLMEGFRRAYDLPVDTWGFWQRRVRASALVVLSVAPFGVASLLVVFGHLVTMWLAVHVGASVRGPVYLVALLVRWGVALVGSVGVIALMYHMGTPLRREWRATLPGAVAATCMWFVTTLVFGWYVTRYANYGQVYGPLGAGIALLFWLYITSLSVLCGAEFNAQIAREPAIVHGKTLASRWGSATRSGERG